MNEKIIELGEVNPLDIYGVNDTRLDFIQSNFPNLRLVARGSALKVKGDSALINEFSKFFDLMMQHFNKHQTLNETDIMRLLADSQPVNARNQDASDDVLVFGNAGLVIKARTPNQRRMVESVEKNDMVFALGPAGTGKTYTAVALAVRALKNKEVKKIILTRPAVEAGENLGFLPGDLKEKLDPYLQPLYDALRDMIPIDKLAAFMENGIIQIAPLAFMRGRTLDNAYVLLDEAQNATQSQMKMFLTRMGNSAKFIITGDVSQIDLPRNQPSGLIHAVKLLSKVKGIDFIELDASDVIRHRLVKNIIEAYHKEN
ncbi:MAG TPA: PhoH family protein [Bacteroidia bacterium]|nr:PhoH family protein [Bacteroidia bacterium]HRH07855.1 PhoH family protein [Bacteroidia bacterium]HRH63594.1 PhoH family protein [Bacteroidia bacterium]